MAAVVSLRLLGYPRTQGGEDTGMALPSRAVPKLLFCPPTAETKRVVSGGCDPLPVAAGPCCGNPGLSSQEASMCSRSCFHGNARGGSGRVVLTAEDTAAHLG